MTNPVILLGTQSNGETLPVQVDATGRLVAEGLQGDKGDKGDKGDPGENGVGELPPNPEDGQVLGWENGQLSWVEPGGGFFFELDYLIIGGGGAKKYDEVYAYSGGGAGGLITSITGEMSGGGVAGSGALQVPIDNNGVLATGISGNEGQDSTLLLPGLSLTAKAGGDGDGKPGGSGGGGRQQYKRYASDPGGLGYPGQGYEGGAGDSGNNEPCWTDPGRYRCQEKICDDAVRNGGGGGAGGAGYRSEPGPGVASTITGESLIYAAGGAGQSYCTSKGGSTPAGIENYGTGEGWNYPRKPGVLYLRYPSWVLLQKRTGGGTLETTEADGLRVSKITNGYCSLLFKVQPGVVTSTVIDYLRSLRD